MDKVEARQALVDAAAKWASGQCNASDVVDVATDALVAGLDSPSLVLLAGTTRADADVEIHDLLPDTMEELHLPFFGWNHPDSRRLAAAGLAREHVDGRLPARDLCQFIHSRFGHCAHDLIEPLAVLDDEYDVLNYSRTPTEAQLEHPVFEAASRIVRTVDDQYREASAAKRRAALAEMTREAEELGLYD
jgi:hypothetical protein